MYLIIILSPFLSSIIFLLKLGKGCLLGIIILLFGLFMVYFLPSNIIYLNLFNFINLSGIKIDVIFFFDNINFNMLFLIYHVSIIVHIYSIYYMGDDPHLNRFLFKLSIFTLFMIILVVSHDLIILFLGWEGVGICSYLLISFWNSRIMALKGAFKAIFYNKIGDIFYLLGVGLIINNKGSTSILLIMEENIGLLFFIGIIAKSAQISLHSWLPDAMEGPTPVSALIHAATMVTAGVYLLIRINTIFSFSFITNIVIFIGALTALNGALMGIYQNDIKKIIAYSTCSQLGYMIVISIFGYFDLGLFHLINHGFFKALLFLSAGGVIHSNFYGEQDLRKIGVKNLNYILLFMIGNLAITGIPFFSGYYSKDIILEILNQNGIYFYIYLFSLFAAILTSIYSIKIYYYFFLPPQNNSQNIYNNNLLLPLIILGFFSIFGGKILNFIFIPIIFISKISIILPLLSIIIGICLYFFYKKIAYNFFINLFYIEKIYSKFYMNFVHFFYIYIILDNFFLEKLGPNVINIKKISNKLIFNFFIYFIIFSLCLIII